MQCTRPFLAYQLSLVKIRDWISTQKEFELTEQEWKNFQDFQDLYLKRAWEIYNTKILSEKGNWIFKHKHIAFNHSDIKEHSGWYELTHLPCGKCPACRINHSNEIGTVATMEAMQWQNNCALTLTYDPKYLPKNRSLCKKDMQDFWKKLYAYIDYHKEIDNREYWENPISHKIEKPQRKIYAGEYGPRTKRPHYHACIFNWAPNWDNCKFIGLSKSGFPMFENEVLTKKWGKGIITVQPFTTETANYCARYTSKKILEDEKGIKLKKNQEPPFIERSRNGRLGIKYWYENIDRWKTENKIIMGNVEKPIPRTFKKLWQKDNPFEYYMRNFNAPTIEDWFNEKDTDLTLYQYLANEEKKNSNLRKALTRNNL